jgi:hypothetical protein
MFSQIRTAAWLCILVCLGLAVVGLGDRAAAGHILWRATMAKDKEAPVIPERATHAVTRPMSVPLNEFVLRPELYGHRDKAELDDSERLKSLMDSLTVEGLQTAVEFFRDADTNPS